MEAWAHFLRDIPGDVLFRVAEAWIRTETRAPKPADILESVAVLNGGDPQVVWRRVQRIIMGREWEHEGFTCDPQMLAAVNWAGGWHSLRWMTPEGEPHRKREFLEGWRQYGRTNAASAALGGGYPEIGAGQ